MSYSSSSYRSAHREAPHGVPTNCWCGENIIIFTSKTKENPYRRFYRCSLAMKRENEDHLFKWVDEVLLEEIKMIEGEHRRIAEDIQDLKKQMMDNMELQNEILKKMEKQLVKKMKQKVDEEMSNVMKNAGLKTVGIVVIVASSVLWLSGRL